MKRTTNLLLILVGLVVAPLSAQDPVGTIRVEAPAVEITNEHPITNEITVVLSDSIMDARIAAALEDIAAAIEAQGCDQCGGTSRLVRAGQGALVLAALFIGWQLKRIADKPNGDTNVDAGDTSVEVNVPEHEHKKREY